MTRNLLCMIGICVGIATPTFAATSIGSLAELLKIGKDAAYPITGSYVLTANIDASSTKTMNSGSGFMPIASGWGAGFTGTFDGAGFAISGLTINRTATDGEFVGLFATLDSGSVVKNLKLLNADIKGNSKVGILVGRSKGTIENCVVSGSVFSATGNAGGVAGTQGRWNSGPMTGSIKKTIAYVNVEATKSHAGGIAGWTYMGTIEDCAAFGTIKANNNAGGIEGNGGDGLVINRCFSMATVISDSIAAGISGSAYSQASATTGKISECWAAGRLIGAKRGGIVGAGNAVVTKSWWDMDRSGVYKSAGSESSFGETSANMTKSATYLDWDFSSIWKINEGKGYPSLKWMELPTATVTYSAEPNGTVTGELTQKSDPLTVLTPIMAEANEGFRFIRWSDSLRSSTRTDVGIYRDTTIAAHFAAPIKINTLAELQKIGTDKSHPMDYEYQLVSDITGNGSTITPIGDTLSFYGILNGGGHSISNLTITGNKGKTGLFYDIETGAEIHSLKLSKCKVTGAGNTGTLAGSNSGAIHNISLDGSSVVSTKNIVGGLVGLNFGTITDCSLSEIAVSTDSMVAGGFAGYHYGGDILRCSVSGTVSAQKHAGGFAGYIMNGAVSECAAVGSVTSKEWVAGGFAGYASAPIVQNSYARCDVTVPSDTVKDVAGFIGLQNGGSILNCYAAGKITGGVETNKGGLFGRATGSVVTSSFWDTELSTVGTSVKGTGLTSAEMKTKESYVGWDFAKIWKISGNYPTLQWQGTNPVAITSVESKAAVQLGKITAVGTTIQIELPYGVTTGKLHFYRVDGRLVCTKLVDQSGTITVPDLATGIYVARLITPSSMVTTTISLQ